jgi:hypothetical protein
MNYGAALIVIKSKIEITRRANMIETLRSAVGVVLEGFTLPHDARKILETAYYGEVQAKPQEQWVKVLDGLPEFYWADTHFRSARVLVVTHSGIQKILYMNAVGNPKPWTADWVGYSPSVHSENIAMWKYLEEPPLKPPGFIWSPRYRELIRHDVFDKLENAPDCHIML